jgi:hypothetical protein
MKISSSSFRGDIDIKRIPENSTISEVISEINRVLTYLEFFNKKVSLQSNLDGSISERVSIAAGATVKIQHSLGVIPKWRIILRQEGNGVISDIPLGWNKNYITLKNNGIESVIISVLIARE